VALFAGALLADRVLPKSGSILNGDRLDVALTLPDDSVHYFNGVVCRFTQLGATEDARRTMVRYRVTLRPWL
jgi:type VI secretion system secreted protein VgrG